VGGDCDEQIKEGKVTFVYTSPESILADMDWRNKLQTPLFRSKTVLIVVDEAHTMLQW